MAGGVLLAIALILADVADAASPQPKAAPTVAVMGFAARQGVTKDTADLLNAHLVNRLRATGAFARIVSMSEVEAALSLEMQRQVASCDSTSCIAEIAGALGADYVVAGNLGRVGEAWLISATLVNAKTGIGERSFSRSIQGSETMLIDAVNAVANELAGTPAPSPDQPVTIPTPAAGVSTPPAVSTRPAPPPPPTSGPDSVLQSRTRLQPLRLVAWLASAGLAVGSALSFAIATMGLLTSGSIFFGYGVVPGLEKYRQPLQWTLWAVLATSGVGVALMLVCLVAACAAAATGFVTG